MSRSNLLINNFNTGEVSELIESRSDLSKYAAACKTLENALPLVEGGAKKMPGTYFAGPTANGGSQFTGSIAGTILAVTEIDYGYPQPGQFLIGSGMAPNTVQIVSFFEAYFSGFTTGTTLVVVVMLGGTLAVGQTVSGAGIAPGTVITAFGSGTGGVGTYVISISQTVGTEDMTTVGRSATGLGFYLLNVSTSIASETMRTESSGKSRLAAFQFSTVQGAILEFSAGIVRIWEGASQGSWSLGLALQAPNQAAYNPATAYLTNDAALVGPTAVLAPNPPPTLTDGILYISAPYGTTNASTVPLSTQINSTDTLQVMTFGTSPNQGILIVLANTTPAHNAASLIQTALRAIGSLNSPSNNFVDLSAWTVTPDPVYFATPWISVLASNFGWVNLNSIVQAVAANQNDEFPFVATNLFPLNLELNTAFWEEFDASTEPPIQLATPYQEADLFALDCSTQSADVLWIFHPSYPPAVIERLTANSWAYSLSLPGQQPGESPYRGTTDVVKTGYSALGQNISLISQSSPCVVVLASSVGSQPFINGSRIYINTCAGLVELNEGEFLVSGIAYGSVSVTVIDSTGTSSVITATGWHMNLQDPTSFATIDSSSYLQYSGGGFAVQVVPLFNSAGNYPACGTLYQERLTVGGMLNNPTQLNGSVQGDYPDFITDPNEDDFAFQFTLVSNQVNQLLNMIGTPNALMIGTSGGVWVVSSANGSSLSQTNVNASQQSTIGVSSLQPQLVNGSAVFVSRSARIVTFMTYSFATNQWDNTDLTRLNRNITVGDSSEASGIAQTAFQVEPYPIFWAVRNDGQLIGLVFNTQDQVYAWFRVNMLPGGGVIESVAVISGQNQEDQLVVVVKRTVDGLTRRYVEYFMPQELFHQLSNAFFVHSGLQFQGVGPFAITNITNTNPAVVTAPGHTLQNGQSIAIANVLGMTQANTNPLTAWTVAGVSGDTLQLSGIDSSSWGFYTSGGTVEQVTNQLTGMSYLLGQTVVAIGDEQVIFEGLVSSDTVAFGSYANQVTIGLPFQTTIQPMNPIIGTPQATSKGKKQKFSRVTLSMYESVGGKVGTDASHLHAISYGQNSIGNPPKLFTGNVTRDLDGDWTDEDTILIVQSDPYPFTLRGVVPRLSVAEEG